VWVKDIDTLFYETACGSGSLGVAIYNYFAKKEKEISLMQPSGYYINIKLNIKNMYLENAIVSGIVKDETIKCKTNEDENTKVRIKK
jgi:hypothetical protein